MKIIAITQRLVKNESYYEVRDALDIRWAKLFKKIGYIPLVLPVNYDFRAYFKMFDIGGIILSGGNDLVSFGGDELSEERDAFEKKLLGFAIRNNIPTLGVCRGMFVIGEYFKAKIEKVKGHVGNRHGLIVSDESAYKGYLRKIKTVNTYHNYALKEVRGGLVVSAKSDDGVIEAIEHERYPVFGQMWHSEREEPFSGSEMKVIKKVFERSGK